MNCLMKFVYNLVSQGRDMKINSFYKKTLYIYIIIYTF